MLASLLTAPSRILYKYWHPISKVLWKSHESNFTVKAKLLCSIMFFFSITATSRRGQSLSWCIHVVYPTADNFEICILAVFVCLFVCACLLNWFDLIFWCVAGCLYRYAMRCRYNAVNFLPNPHKIHLIARPLERVSNIGFITVHGLNEGHIAPCPLERGMGCILWVQNMVYTRTLHQLLQWCMQYHVILDCVITALDCIWQMWYVVWGVLKNVLLFNAIVLGVISFACLDMLVWSSNKITSSAFFCTTPYNQDKAKYRVLASF